MVQDTFALAHAAAAESPDTAGWDLYETMNGGHGASKPGSAASSGTPISWRTWTRRGLGRICRS